MEIQELGKGVYYFRFNEEHDWPNLGYVCGDKYALAIDAGFSKAHVKEFYSALQKKGLRLPDFTVITHWHWDHSLGLGGTEGISIANELTNKLLVEEGKRLKDESYLSKLKEDYEFIVTEFPDGVIDEMRPSDITYSGKLSIDLGGLEVSILQAESTHTDDSSLVWIKQAGVLFIGDAAYDNYFTSELEVGKQLSFVKTVRDLKSKIIVSGHQLPMGTEEYFKATDELNALL